jgi:hypothetical protein
MEETVTGEVFKTGDLPLAAYLRMRGIRHMTMELIEDPATNKDVAEWVYAVDSRARSLLKEFQTGQASVEPRRYAKALRVTRNDLHAFLGYVTDEG